MPYLELTDDLKVGNKVIDREHEVLFSYINLLQKALENESRAHVTEQVILGLAEYTKTHFFVEEELMAAYDYPDYDPHKKAHEIFKKKINALLKEFEQGRDISLQSMLDILKKWITDHILTVDARLAEFLKDKTPG